MKNALLFSTFVLVSLFANSQTSVPGGNVSGAWSLAGSPYLVQGSIMIPNGSTLTIESGVTVNFQGHYKLLVSGRLLAIGTITDSISFTASNTSTGWYGIRFDNTATTNDTSKITFSKIQWGKANGSANDAFGGAFIMNNFSKVVVSNCLIKNNSATSGGAFSCIASSPVISDNFISYNTAEYGGSIHCNNSNPIIYNNLITHNTATTGGGGGIQCVMNSNPSIDGNTFLNNSTSGGGGAIYCTNSSPAIFDNTFTSNTANMNAGAIYADVGCSSIISNNIISYNSCTFGSGGGITTNFSNATIYNNLISNNSAASGGGIGTGLNDSPIIHNNIICNNSSTDASTGGGGIYCYSSDPTLTNNTIVNNSCAGNGGGLYCGNSSNPILRNCILYNNSATASGSQAFFNDEASDPAFYFSDVEGSSTDFGLNGNFYTGTYQNNININPAFVSPSANSGTGSNGVTADWTLQSNSPCIDTGDPNGSYPATDKAGNDRIVGSTIDIGAYEYQGPISVENYDLLNPTVIYPNPFNYSTTIQLSATVDNGELNIYDINGKKTSTINNITTDKIILERDNLHDGIYFFNLTEDSKTIATGKLIITD